VRLATQTVAHLRRRLNRSANANVCASDDGVSGTLLTASWDVRPPHRRLRRSPGRWLVRPRRLLHLFHGQSDAPDRADDPRTARRNKCRGFRTSTRASSAVVSKAIPLRQVGGGRATDALQRWTSIILPAAQKISSLAGITARLLESPLHRALLTARENGPLGAPVNKGGSRHGMPAHSVSSDDSGGIDGPRHTRSLRVGCGAVNLATARDCPG
jgi:hypothetical protein